MKKLKIGSLTLDVPVILAPMAGVNCASFRLVCRDCGAGMVSTPMIVANQITANPEKIIERTCFLKQEKPISVQLVGSDSSLMKEATLILDEFADVIDINLGCPEKDILSLKAGAFFVKHPDQIKKAVSPVISSTNKPVTAKIRTGWDRDSINTLETVKILEDLGVSAISIHGRTKWQKYRGKADWNEIMKAKEQSSIPVIGNGDIFKPDTAKAMIEQTSCDGVMVGRGAMGYPLIFKGIKTLLDTGKNPRNITEKEQIETFMKFLHYYKKHEKERSISELRQHAMWFTKGLRGAKRARNDLMKCKSVEAIVRLYERFFS